MKRRRRQRQQQPNRMRFLRRMPLPSPRMDFGNDPKYPSSLSLRLVRKLPLILIANPERVVLNFAFILVGIGALFTQETGSIFTTWPMWCVYSWCLAMMVGGGCVLYGMFVRQTTIERLGYLLVGPACFAYALSVVWVRGLIGLPVGLIFLGLSVAKLIRMIISTADRDQTIEYGARLEREAHEGHNDEDDAVQEDS